MKHYRTTSVCLFLLAWGSLGLCEEGDMPSSRQLGRTDKFRVLVDKVLMQQGPDSKTWRMKDEYIREIRDAGFNVVVPRYGGEDLARVRDVARRSQKHGIRYMPWLRGTLHAYYKNSDNKRMIWENGVESRMYSPNADAFWQWWTRLIVGYAKISAEEKSMIGVFLDFENYFKGKSAAYDLSYDDIIFQAFIAAQNMKAIAVAPKDRHAWLAEQGLHQKFADFQIDRWRTKCRALRQAIDAVNPRFQLFVYPTPVESLFIQKAVAQELATKQAPMVIADWRTYGRPPGAMTSKEGLLSNRLYLETKLNANREFDLPHTMYISGIDPVLKHTDPEFCGRSAAMISEKVDGYWVFYEGPQYKTTHPNYFRWFARSNRAIVEGRYAFWKAKRETPEPFSTTQITHPKNIQQVLSEPITVHPLVDMPETAEPLRRYELRDDQHIVIQPKVSERLRIRLFNRNRKLTKILTYALYDSEGRQVVRGSLVDETDVHFPAIAGETYHLFLTGPGFYMLQIHDAAYAIDGRQNLHLRAYTTPLYFHVSAEVNSFTLTMRSGAPGETAVATLFDPQNRSVAALRTVEQPIDQQTIDCRGHSNGYWKLVVDKADQGALDDVHIEFGPELTGYCSLEPGKLLLVEPAEARPARTTGMDPFARKLLGVTESQLSVWRKGEELGLIEVAPVHLPVNPPGDCNHYGWPVATMAKDTLLVMHRRIPGHRRDGAGEPSDKMSYGVVLRSTDGGQQWSRPYDLRNCMTPEDRVRGGIVPLSHRAKFDPTNKSPLGYKVHLHAIGTTRDGNVIAVNNHGVFRSDDAGHTWKHFSKALREDTFTHPIINIGPRIVDDPQHGLLVFGNWFGEVDEYHKYSKQLVALRSRDGGKTWQTEEHPVGFKQYEPAVLHHNHQYLFVTRDQNQVRSHRQMTWLPGRKPRVTQTNLVDPRLVDTVDLSFNPETGRLEMVRSERHHMQLWLWSIDPKNWATGQWRRECRLMDRVGKFYADADGFHPAGAVVDIKRGLQHVFIYAGHPNGPAGVFRITRSLSTPKLAEFLNAQTP